MIDELEDKFLEARKITGGYGSGPDILHSCNISVGKGEIAVIVGPNGAGKSTAMKAIFGMLDVREGSILLGGVDITNLNTHCLLYTSPSPRDKRQSRMPSSA